MKKAYITGTTKGIGKEIKHRLERWFVQMYMFDEFEVVGLDRPEYNMNVVEPYVKDDFEVYVINAHHEFDNVELLYRLFEENQKRRCDIVVIGSVSTDGDRNYINRYAVQKTALEKAVAQLQLTESTCRIMMIKPGRVKSPLSDHRSMHFRMDPSHVAHAIVWMLEQPNFLNVRSLTLDVHHTAKELH